MGVEKYVDEDLEGVTYEGEFLNEMKHGKGVLKYPDGDFYDGYWVHDHFHGWGVISIDGIKYEG